MAKRGAGRNRLMRRKSGGGGAAAAPGLGGGNDQIAQAQEMIAKAQQELAEQTVEGTAGGGMVRVTMSGNQKIVGIQLEPDAVDPDDVEMLQDLIMAAIGDAAEKAEELQSQSLGAITGGLNLPGLG